MDSAPFQSLLDDFQPDLVFLLLDNLAVPPQMCTETLRAASLEMVRIAADGGWPVLMSGPDVSNDSEPYLQAGATWAVTGDVDAVLLEVAQGEHAAGAIAVENPLVDLDSLPLPPWELVDLTPYRDLWIERHGYWELNLSTSRGCPYRCNWCAKPIWGRTYHVRSADRVAQDLEHTLKIARPDRIWFTDDIFAIRPKWLRAFADAVEAKALKTPFRCLSRVDLLRDDSFTADLSRAGCGEVWVGAESGSQAVLDAMDKDCTVEDIARATDLLHQHGISVGFFLQLGYPGEALSDVLKTLAMVRQLRPDEIGVSVSYPLPGTPFYDRVRDQMSGEAWQGSMDCDVLFDTAYSQRFYDLAKRALTSEHRIAALPRSTRAFLRTPNRFTGRRLASTFLHAGRLPFLHWELRKEASPK
jgi:radical SAM superfamily enzyme YgiQ (UPF0313 family)